MASENETLDEKKQQEAEVEEELNATNAEEEVKMKAEVKDEVAAGEEKREEDKNEEDEEKGEEKEEDEKEDEAMEVDAKEEKEEEKVEEKEEEEEDKKVKKRSSKKEKGKEKTSPVTPTIERPTRERKTVERYTETSAARGSATKPLSIEKGRGTQLKDIPNVAFKLSKRKPDDSLQMLHSILFGKKTKAHSLKKNIGMFSGYVWSQDEEEKQRAKIKEKLDKCVKEKLLDFCDILNVPINKAVIKKEEVLVKLLEFLESPQATTDALIADKEKKSKKRKGKSSNSKTSGSSDAALEKVTKKQKKNSQVGEKRKNFSRTDEIDDKTEPSDREEDSVEDNDLDVAKIESDQHESNSEEDVQEEKEEPKKQIASEKSYQKNVKKDSGSKSRQKSKAVKERSPAKSPKSPAKLSKVPSSTASKKRASEVDTITKPGVSSNKKQKGEKDIDRDHRVNEKASVKKQSGNSSAKHTGKDQGKGKSGKKARAEPSREEMHTVVVDILKEVDFNTATLSDILRKLGSHFGVDLMHRKSEVKAIITEVINNMTDEEDEEDEELESEGNAEKDDDDDNDA